jgi:transcriptional regulator with XRE-family HTH domain
LFTLDLYPDEWLRIMRSRLELTQAQLAQRLGLERRTVSRYEAGLFRIPPAKMEAIKRMADDHA